MASEVFQRFTTDAKLDAGICLLRGLGDGKFEIVNLQKVSCPEISSEEMGLVIKNDKERLDALDIEPKAWEEVQLKAWQGVRSANLAIFRFFKLPIELRYKIYDLVLIANKPIHILKEKECSTLFNPKLLHVCRDIKEEATHFFYRNTFHLTQDQITKAGMGIRCGKEIYASMVRKLCFSWHGLYTDKRAFENLASFPELETLVVMYASHVPSDFPEARAQKLHQDNPLTSRFCNAYGFDALTMLRGLKEVTLERIEDYSKNPSLEAHHNFERFLNELLTEPKPQPSENNTKGRASRKGKGAKTKPSKKQIKRELMHDINNLA